MKTISKFTKSANQAIQESIFRVRRMPYGDFYGEQEYNVKAPEVLLVKIPMDGIPPLTMESSGGPNYTVKYTMGKAECDVMYIEKDFSEFNDGMTSGSDEVSFLNDVDAFAKEIFYPSGSGNQAFKEWIYNPYPWTAYGMAAAIDPEDELTPAPFMFTLAVRDRSGFFICARPPDILKVMLDNSVPPDEWTNAHVYLAGEDSGETVEAWNNWSSSTFEADKPYFVKFFEDERKWVLMSGGGSSQAESPGIHYIAGDNDDHEGVPSYGILWHSDDGQEVSGGNRVMDAARPFDTFSTNWYVNRGEPISIGAMGYCDTLIEKPGPVRIDDSLIGTITPFSVIGPKPNSYTLWPGYPGFLTIGDDYLLDGKAVVDCIQKPVTRVFGRLYQDLTQNADGTATSEFEIWRRDVDGKRKPAGWNQKLQVYGTLLNKNEVAKQGTFGWADYHSHYDKWEADFACDPDNTGSSQSASPGALNAGNDFAALQAPVPGPSDVQTGVIS